MDQTYIKKLITRPKFYMNESEGVVKEVRGEKALVITDRQEMCASCVAKNFCHMLGGGKEVLSETINPVGAKTGDMVKIGIPDGAVTKASLIVYMVPAIGFVGGASIGYFIAKLYGLDLNISTLIGGLIGFGLSMISVRFLNNTLSKRPYYQPEITKIIHPDSIECGD